MTCRNENKNFPVRKKVRKKYEPSGKSFGRFYSLLAKKQYIDPDPLLFLRKEGRRKEEKELIALIASSLAFGRVDQIMSAVEKVLSILSLLPGNSPVEKIKKASREDLEKYFSSFRYRFVSGENMAFFLAGAGSLFRKYGSLEKAFLAGYDEKNDPDILPALEKFGRELCKNFPSGKHFLFPLPSGGSACKRPLLMLRWLIRQEDVDTGLWKSIPAKKLLYPLDTHMFRIACSLGFCTFKTPSLAASAMITKAFAKFSPEDPVKYDFPLTRFGIHPSFKGKNICEVLRELENTEEAIR